MRIVRRVRGIAAVTMLSAADCTGETALAPPKCAVRTRAAADYGPPSPMPQTASIAIELSGIYIREQVRKLLEAELPKVPLLPAASKVLSTYSGPRIPKGLSARFVECL